ncbi:uncharacterized protein LTR77_006896 [Saxophila tyrrhenica]|uniref:Mediator of RNA polymerase II transcription subunit 19 n=1 Tax=Saxophila tyrrhenica TaxID=1690608 RepID=A0AAV9P861_9PEZI|nr:hypothetical protein LTR77_006896 [Saxophila tyrrhenica]
MSSTPLKRAGDDLVDERGVAKKARTSAPTPSASPPADHTMAHHPETPPLGTTQLPGLGMQHEGHSKSSSVRFPTPPSTASFHSHMMARGASSEGAGVESSDDQTPTEHRRTDHEREGEETQQSTADSSLPAATTLYKLRTDPIPPSSVPGTANLLELYDLTTLQSTVARYDPVTGEKINRLRKHYAGKVKQLGLDGKNKPLKKELELQGLLDPAWSYEGSSGRTLWEEQRSEAFLEDEEDAELAMSKLELAFSGFKEGSLPKSEHEHWKTQLGLDEQVAAVPAAAAKQQPVPAVAKAPAGTAAFLAKTAPARNSAPASPSRAQIRPERSGKKRRYDENSWEGYDDDGYSTGGLDDTGSRRGSAGGGGGKRVKRKVSAAY